MSTENGCELWEKARVTAQERGLTMSPTCPMDEYCNPGTKCVYLAHKVQQIVNEGELNQVQKPNRFSYLRGNPQEVPQERKPEVLKHHIKRDGRR